MSEEKKTSEECCPRFDPAPWQDKEVEFENRLFVRGTGPLFLHFPLNIGKVMGRLWAGIEKNKAQDKEFLMLSRDLSAWKGEHLIAVSKEVPGLENIRLSGTFLTKVFDGPYSDARFWVEEAKEYVESKGKEMKDLYFFYTTCPKCAKKYGHNYVVAFAKVD